MFENVPTRREYALLCLAIEISSHLDEPGALPASLLGDLARVYFPRVDAARTVRRLANDGWVELLPGMDACRIRDARLPTTERGLTGEDPPAFPEDAASNVARHLRFGNYRIHEQCLRDPPDDGIVGELVRMGKKRPPAPARIHAKAETEPEVLEARRQLEAATRNLEEVLLRLSGKRPKSG